MVVVFSVGSKGRIPFIMLSDYIRLTGYMLGKDAFLLSQSLKFLRFLKVKLYILIPGLRLSTGHRYTYPISK